MQYQTPLEIAKPNTTITASIIWLHGLGADGYDFAPIVERLNLNHIRFILPHAPDMPITRNNGYVMPAWYDVYGLTGNGREDAAGIKASQTYINTLIEQEIGRGIASHRIVIAGFSQGGAIALQTALRYPKTLAGVLALSTYLPLKNTLSDELASTNLHTPILMAHGVNDDIITLEVCKNSLAALQAQQCLVDYHEYKMAHSVCEAEISDIRTFLQRVIPSN